MENLPFSHHLLKEIPIEVTVSVGHARPTVKDLLDLSDNSVLTLDRHVDDPVDLYVGDQIIARGVLEEAEGELGGRLAVRLTEVAIGGDIF